MQNILPRVVNLLGDTNARVSKLTEWNVQDSNPATAKIDRKLESSFTVDSVVPIKYRKPQVVHDAPNYVDPDIVDAMGPSPLDASVRSEVLDPTVVNMEGMRIDSGVPAYMKPKMRKPSHLEIYLFLRLYSRMPMAIDVYMQKQRSMKVFSLQPFGEELRLLGGDKEKATYSEAVSIHILCSPMIRSTVAMTTRRVLLDFDFNKFDRIGMEVEVVDGKLTCTKVLPDTQATPHALHLDSAEIVAVNGERVLDLSEFQAAMQRAKAAASLPNEQYGIQLTVAAFQGGKSRVDDLYLHDFSTQQRMKSLMSNLFSGLGGGGGGDHTDDDTASAHSADEETDSPDHGPGLGGPGDHNRSVHSNESKKQERDSSFMDLGVSICNDEGVIAAAEAARANVEGAPDAKDDDEFGAGRFRKRHFDSDDEDGNKEEGSDDEGKRGEVSFEDDDDGGMRAQRKHVGRDTDNTMAIEAKYITEEAEVLSVHEDPKPVEPPKKEEEWNALTKVEVAEERMNTVYPFSSVVCVPRPLAASGGWGLPQRYIQFTNFTSTGSHSSNGGWRMDIYWVDEEGALVPRHELKGGGVHLELCDVQHVWAVVASPMVKTPSSRAGQREQSINSLVVEQSQSLQLSGASQQVQNCVDIQHPHILLVRPCEKSLQEGKCLSIIWTPWLSLSVSQIVHPQTKKSATSLTKKNIQDRTARVQPVIHIQLFEPPLSKLTKVVEERNTVLQSATSSALLPGGEDEDQSVGSGNLSRGRLSPLGGWTHGHHEDDDHSFVSQRSHYSSMRKDLEDFKAAIRETNTRFQGPAAPQHAQVVRKPLISTGTLHKLRKK